MPQKALSPLIDVPCTSVLPGGLKQLQQHVAIVHIEHRLGQQLVGKKQMVKIGTGVQPVHATIKSEIATRRFITCSSGNGIPAAEEYNEGFH